MNSGTITVKGMWVGYAGSGTLNMNGGTITVVGVESRFRIADRAKGTSHVNLDGGIITADYFDMRIEAGAVGTMDVRGGTLIIDGDDLSLVQGYINNGWITAFDGTGTLLLDYNVTNKGKTTLRALVSAASNPGPADKAIDVCQTAVLGWMAGEFAETHDVYFGTDEANVTDANTTEQLGVLVSQEQTETYYPTVATLDLEYGETYYWRVDEVNAAPDYTVYKGYIWQFTTEPVAYRIDGKNVTATASSSDTGTGPQNTVNGSGLDEDDLHSIEKTAMWLSGTESPGQAWIKYEFDRDYKLHQMWVWNYNEDWEPSLGLGVNDVTIEYSTNDTDYTPLGTTHVLNPGTGLDGYEHNTEVPFNGVVAKYVRLTANSNQKGILDQYGLSEVRFFYIPVRAREPNPASGATNVALDAVLSWIPGREAAMHDVYLSTSERAVIKGTIDPCSIPADGPCESSYGPLSLELGKTYYWKVNEVNMVEEPNTWEGEIWSFSTPAYFVVDDMTLYGDVDEVGVPGSKIWYTWKDGESWPTDYTGNGTGSVIELDSVTLYDTPQSMAYHYSSNGTNFFGNTGKAYYSEATALISDLEIGNDWSVNGIKSLSLHFYGDPGNDAGPTEQMYVKLNGAKVVYDGDANDITEPSWHEWSIDLAVFGINLQNVTEISIGFGNEGNVSPGGLGVVYFDDIRLYPSGCVLSRRSADFARVDFVEDCLVDYKELDLMAANWLVSDYNASGDGTLMNFPSDDSQWVTGQINGALNFDGTDDYVNIDDYKGINADRTDPDNPVQQPFSVACWIKTSGNAALVTWGSSDGTDVGGQYQSFRIDGGTLRAEHGDGNLRGNTVVNDGEWHHCALTVVEGANLRVPQNVLYVDGVEDTVFSGSDNIYNLTADADISIGRRASHGDRYFTGLIDDVRIYDYALSNTEVANIANETGDPVPGPWLWYKFDETSGHIAKESVGTVIYVPLPEPIVDLYWDGTVDFKDFAELALWWLDEQLWP